VITTVPMGVSIEIEGLAGVAQRLEARIREQAGQDTEIAIVAGGARGASKNALIAKFQAARLRNPFYLNARTVGIVKAAAPALFSAAGAAKRTAETIGAAMLISIHENVDAQRNADGGKFTALSAKYAAYKRRKFGFVTPVLRATGDLLGGLKVRVIRAAGGGG
jgi:hypothetical protein